MAQPQLAVKIVSNTAELIANLNAGKGAIESYGPSIAKMQETWARNGALVVEKAATVTAAMKDISVSTLTASDAAKNLKQLEAGMAQLGKAGQPIPPLMQETADKLRAINDVAKPSSGFFSDLGSQVKATALGFISAQAVIGVVQGAFRTLTAFVGSSIDSYAAAEAAARKMTVALKAQGTATPDVIQQYDKLAAQFQKTTVYGDDLVNEMQALLTSVGDVAPAQMEKALTAATDLASGLGIDLRTATIMVAKASEENVGALKKAGVALDETRVKGEGMSYILSEIEKKFGGQAQGEIDTYAGKVKQLANEWDNFKESVGKSIIENPFVVAALRNMTKEAQAFNAQPEASTPGWTKWLGLLGAGLDRIYERQKHINADRAAFDKIQAGAFSGAAGIESELGKVVDPFAGMMAGAKKFGDELVTSWKKGDAAAKKYADQVEAGFRKWSGAGATEQMGILDANFRTLAASGKLTKDQIDAIVKEAIKLQGEGAKLTDRLWEMARVTNALHPSLKLTALNLKDIGTEVAVNALHVDAYVKAVAQLGAMSKTITVGSLTFGGNKDIDIGKPIIPKAPRQSIWEGMFGTSAEMGQYLAQTITGAFQGGGDALKSGISAIGSMAMGNLGKSLVGTVDKAGPLFNSALGKVFAGALPIIGSLIGPLAGAIWNKLFGTAGRDAVKDFVAGFGGFDAFHAMLGKELPQDAERYWVMLTQGVGRNNPEQARAVIEQITAALAKQKEKTAEVAAAAAESSAAQQAALDAISEKYSGAISKLESEYKSLSDSVSKEAAEEFMGIVETQERARMEQIEAEKAAQIIMRDAEIAAKQETFDQVLAAGTDTYNELRRIFGQGLDIPTRYGVPGFQTGSGYGYVPSGVPTSSRDSGYSGGASSSRASTSGGGDTYVKLVMPNGDVLLEEVVRTGKRKGWMQ